MTIIDYIRTNSPNKLDNVLELGSGDQADALQIISDINGKYFAIDKKNNEKENIGITFINADYFDIDYVDKIINNDKFDLIFSNYSLCFNQKDVIIKSLPYYLNKITQNGIFYLSDFNNNEQVVKKRTNLYDEWFFELIKTYFKSYNISEREVYEKEHDHTHNIFELIAYK